MARSNWVVSVGVALLILVTGVLLVVAAGGDFGAFAGWAQISNIFIPVEACLIGFSRRTSLDLRVVLPPMVAATVVGVGFRVGLLGHSIAPADRVVSIFAICVQLGLFVVAAVLAFHRPSDARGEPPSTE